MLETPSASKVEAVLQARADIQDRPNDDCLRPLYDYLTSPSSVTETSSSSSGEGHWYCHRALSSLHREAATYLIILFVFSRQGLSKTWVEKLEAVVEGCEGCARAFGSARRRLSHRYLTNWPDHVQANIFGQVNRWQLGFVTKHVERARRTPYGSSPNTGPALYALPHPIVQLLLSEPALIKKPDPILSEIKDLTLNPVPPVAEDPVGFSLISEAISSSVPPPSHLVSSGVTPSHIKLLGSADPETRRWVTLQLPAAARRPINFTEWCTSGIGSEIQALYGQKEGDNDSASRWEAVEAIMSNRVLESDALEKGLYTGRLERDPKGRCGRGLMSALAGLLSSDMSYFPSVLSCFATVLRTTPNRSVWSFDPSPELPRTIFSELRSNRAFESLLARTYNGTAENDVADDGNKPVHLRHGKEKQTALNHLDWIGNFLVSLADVETVNPSPAASGVKEGSGFSETLATVALFTFAEMQHSRFSGALRAAAATAGFQALMSLHQVIPSTNLARKRALNSVIDLHSAFVTTVGLRAEKYPAPTWSHARDQCRELLTAFFRDDADSVVRSVLAMASVSYAEKKRLVRKRKGKKDVPSAVPVDSLPLASIKKSLWNTTYEALSPMDTPGVAVILRSLAPFAHLELLDRQGSWTHRGMEEVVKKEDWVTAVRAVNSAIQISRESFPRAVESAALQADPELVKALWIQPDIPHAITLLLLSPDDNVHTPIITLIQQSFEDVDDRGDCFRALLRYHPESAMEGLTDFLRTFITTASHTPESCSLAKWLVRCFYDVLEALCRRSGDSDALLERDDFLKSYVNGRSMTKRIEELWHLMTTSLALIFKRTLDWAPYFENQVMVDWMRDALIYGRQMTEQIRAFEGAAMGQSSSRNNESAPESPKRTTSVGKKMTRQLDMVLSDLILWLRLTDVETLFQTHQLIKTILSRIGRSDPDVTSNPTLENTLQDIDKYCRKSTKGFTSKLTDDLLAELSELLVPFNLVDKSEDVQFVKSVSALSSTDDVTPVAKPAKSQPVVRNAFAEMMKASGSKAPIAKDKPKPIMPVHTSSDIDDIDDDFLSGLSASDLDIIEKRAKIASKTPSTSISGRPVIPTKLQISARPQVPSNRLHVNLVPQPPAKPPTVSTFKSKFMRELRKEHQKDHQVAGFERKRTEIGGIVPKLPAASALGTGLGAYTGSRPKTVQPVDSGSSASDSSDEENRAVTGLLAKQKSPPKVVRPVERRSIKVLGNDMSDIMRRNEERRANAHATKMRLKPDLNPLYRHVLAWDPNHTGSTAPHGQKSTAELAALRGVPTTFASAKQYEQVMLPLYLQELWSQCVKEATANSSSPVAVEVSSRQYEDDFVEIDLAVMGPMMYNLNDTDVVTLRQAGNSHVLFAKVQAFRKRPKDIAIKVKILASMDQKELGGRSKWQLRKHLSLSTALREFGALRGLPYYEPSLLQDILGGRSAMMPKLALDDIEEAMNTFDVNEPQARAILGSLHVKGFALIQGPPGTGKTKTISGLVGKWLSERRIPMSTDGRPPPKPKILVCAPSNAAIDEVCKRLILGVPGSSGTRIHPVVVRIGMDQSVNVAVKDVSLDSLVEAKVNADTGGKDGSSEYARVQAELDGVKQQIKDKQEELRLAQNNDDKRKVVENDYHALVTKRTQLGQAASRAKDAARDATRHLDGARRAAKEQILNEADIICSTLSGAGQDTLAAHPFDTVIIDEAAQAIEMSCLIPLKYGCRRCIMVGDPNQLPPTTFSVEADRFNYNESLFVRMTKHNSSHVSLLSIQYRMHPFISELPSKVFYNGKLKDGPDMARKTAALWHQRNVFGPYRFFNIEGVELKAGTSTKNPDEALAAVDLYKRLNADFGTKVDLAMRVGVISMYKEQLNELKRRFTDAFGSSILEAIDFNTVDGFQGQEKDIIILSCVRSGPNLRSIGFLKDARRINVALTRAKSSLFVFGNGPTLERSDERWKTIVGDARDRGFFVNYTPSTFGPGALEPASVPKIKKKSRLSDEKPSKDLDVSPEILLPPKELAVDMSQAIKRKPSFEVTRSEKKRVASSADLSASTHSVKPVTVPSKDSRVAKTAVQSHASKAATPPSSSNAYGPQQDFDHPTTASKPPQPKGPPPPQPPQRPPEDVLFIKKKKKPGKSATNSTSANTTNVRAAMNERFGGRP
ncbi:hypothetical protein IAU60_001067 [Kwoniella sp. DSM 27419]